MPPKRTSSDLDQGTTVDEQKVNDRGLDALRTNRGDVDKADSDDYNLTLILRQLNTKTEKERKKLLKHANFGPWIQGTYGIRASQAPRLLAILNSPFWTNLWSSYVKTPYGEKVLNFSAAERITHTKLGIVSVHSIFTVLYLRRS